MAAGQVGVFAKYFITKRFAPLASVSQVLSGRNAGESLTWAAGFTYFMDVNKKAEAAK